LPDSTARTQISGDALLPIGDPVTIDLGVVFRWLLAHCIVSLMDVVGW